MPDGAGYLRAKARLNDFVMIGSVNWWRTVNMIRFISTLSFVSMLHCMAFSAEINVRDLNPPGKITGILGKPLGTKLTVEGTVAESTMSSSPLNVQKLDGRTLDQPIALNVRGNVTIERGSKFKLEGYESGEFSSPPTWLAPGAQHPFQFHSFFVVTKVIDIAGPISTDATEVDPVLRKVEDSLKPVLATLDPSPEVEYTNDSRSLQFRYHARKFMIHRGSMTGQRAINAVEEVGPSFRGFVLRVHVESLGAQNQAVLPQTIREPYWQTYLSFTPVAGTRNQINWGLSFGSRTDKELLAKIKLALASLGNKDE